MKATKLLVGLLSVGLVAFAGECLADSLVVTGAGSPGTWTTEVEIANPTAEPIPVQVFLAAQFVGCGPFPVCLPSYLTIPSNGTKSLSLSNTLFNPTAFLETIFITPSDPAILPVVRARALNSADPSQSVALPVIRLSTLNAFSPQFLIFPGASRSDAVHSNIVVGAVAQDGTSPIFSVLVEVYSADGTLLASEPFANVFGDYGNVNIFLVDVLGYMGIQSLDGGQIRVTKLSGDGSLWGEMATLGAGNSVVMTQGINP